jgi:hypothetical protein
VTRPISGPAGLDPYQSVRYGNFTYRFPVANGNYRVLLRFAEIYHRARRRPPVLGDDQRPAQAHLVRCLRRRRRLHRRRRPFDIAVTGGEIALGFVSQIDYALVNAIEIQPLTTAPPQAPAVAVALTPATATVASGGTLQFTAQVTNAANSAVTWSLTPAVGQHRSGRALSGSGRRRPATVVTVRATSVADPAKSATAQIT